MRYAIYFTPSTDSALARFGAAILGYDASTGSRIAQTCVPEADCAALDELTRAPRSYGFHATLKAPMELADGCGEADFLEQVREFSRFRTVAGVGQLEVDLLDGFIALVPARPSGEVAMLAAECTATFDRCRGSLKEADRQRRIRQGLSPRQIALLDRWGYPYVFDQYRFHMTLTGRVSPDAGELWRRRLEQAFGDLRRETVIVDALSVLRQPSDGAPFRLIERIPLQR